jgi:hypothetical protein
MKHLPHMPSNLLDELRSALKTAHEALLEPPERVKEDPEKLKNWRPAVRTQVNWEAIGQGDKDQPIDAPPANATTDEEPVTDSEGLKTDGNDEDAFSKYYLDNKFLTIGVIGEEEVATSRSIGVDLVY